MSSSLQYQPAHQPLLSQKDGVQKFEFDSPNTIAKQQQFQQAGGFQPAGGFSQGISTPPAPALPQSRSFSQTPRRNLNLRTRDWNGEPWRSAQAQTGIQGDTYAPPASLVNSNWGSNSRSGGVSSYPSSGLSQTGVYSSGIPTSNYQPSSTIPLQHNYHLPSSQLAQSSTPYTQQIATQQIAPQQINVPLLNKNYGSSSGFNSGLQTQNNGIQDQSWNNGLQTQNYGLSSGLNSGLQTQNYGIQDQSWNNGLQTQNQSSIPTPPALPNWNRSRSWRTQRSVRPLRTRDWGYRTDNGWSNFKYQAAVEESFLRNRAVPAPHPPPMPSMLRPRKWHSGPYRQQRNLRTRNWGNRNGDGWSNFNRGIYAHESALPFNNRNRSVDWADQSGSNLSQQQFQQQPLQSGSNFGQQQFQQQPLQSGSNFGQQQFQQQPFQSGSNFGQQQFQQQPLQSGSNFGQQQFAPVSRSISSAPISAAPIAAAPIAATPLGANNAGVAPLTGRKGRRLARKQAKQNAIQGKLLNQLNPPIGDPAVNHYRRGARATVPTAGPLTGGVAPSIGSKSARRRGRRNNLGSRRGRAAGQPLPVPAVQPPFVAAQPVAQPTMATAILHPLTTFQTVVHPSAYNSSSAGIPLATSGVPMASSGVPLSTSGIQQPLYSSSAQQSRPLSSTLTNSQGTVANQPLYSAKEPVVGGLLHKQAQAPVSYARPTGSATF